MPPPDRPSANDLRILALLQRDGRASYEKLGAAAGMSAPSMGWPVEMPPRMPPAWLERNFGFPRGPLRISSAFSSPDIAAVDEVEECHHIAGEADYLLKIRAVDTLDLERVMRRVQAIRHVYTSETEIVFSTAFEGRPLPLQRETDGSLEA